MEETTIKIKRIDLEIHGENYNRRVNHGNTDFDILVVSLQDENGKRYFGISKKDLPETDSIHLKYSPSDRSVSWSPQEIISHVVELTKFYCGG
jgi:hypothetical protein